ncbi:MAG: HAD family hydrolase [Alphaproteobacteria bacterium]|jgi:HAD superfamily hydrolase (TIGR01509 family)|nr:HAD-IA family hydrolase [Candidatus Jidaibacter sp.]
MDNNQIQAIIFDVDGVIFKTYDENGNFLWCRNIKNDLGLTSKHLSFIFSDKWDSIIRGTIDLNDHLQEVFQHKLFQDLAITQEQYMKYWLSHDHQVNQDILDLVKSLKIPCYLGTNQEACRTNHILDTAGSYFKECFASYTIGFIKPEQGFFQHVQKALSLSPYELLLIDDTKNNIEGAQKCGWQVYHYQNDIDALINFLKKHDVL